MASSEPLPPAQSLLSKVPVHPAQPRHDFQTVPNLPAERGNNSQRVVPAAAAAIATSGVPALYNSPSVIPVPRTTLYNQRKRAAQNDADGDSQKRQYKRSTTFNICKHCHLPKTKNFGHSRHIGRYGLETFCPSVEGKGYANVTVWLEERRKENPRKSKD